MSRAFFPSLVILGFGLLLAACSGGRGHADVMAEVKLFEFGKPPASPHATEATAPAATKMELVGRAVSPAGDLLAEASQTDPASVRVVLSTADGQLVAEQVLPIRLQALRWSSRGDLLVVGHRLQVFSFGANVQQLLYRVYPGELLTVTLSDLTVKPRTARYLAEQGDAVLRVAFAPMGDELVYSRLHDPPDAPPYVQLAYRNWQVERERELIRLPVEPVMLHWSESDAIRITGAGQVSRRLELWTLPLGLSAIVPGTGEAVDSGYDEQLWTLRRWRFEGLITPEEFTQQLKESNR